MEIMVTVRVVPGKSSIMHVQWMSAEWMERTMEFLKDA